MNDIIDLTQLESMFNPMLYNNHNKREEGIREYAKAAQKLDE
jgi:hypothetical protein